MWEPGRGPFHLRSRGITDPIGQQALKVACRPGSGRAVLSVSQLEYDWIAMRIHLTAANERPHKEQP